MKTTIADVAGLAGVAKSTVSRYLNGGYVSDETRKKIDQVIKDTKYEPNTFAQSLKAKKTNLVGVVIPRLNSYSASLTLKGIDEKLRGEGYQLLISNTDQSIDREIESLYSFANQKVAGIILMATQITKEHLMAIREIEVPILSIGQEHQGVASLVYNDEEAGYDLAQYVLGCGHRRMIYVGVSEADVAVGKNRKRGFYRALEEAEDVEVDFYETDFSMKSAYRLFDSLNLEGKTLIACATDNIALGMMKALGERGISIPGDISITGFGDYEVADIMGLTTMHYPYEEAGQLAAQTVLYPEAARVSPPKSQIIFRKSVDILK
ncbi:MAG: LacI family DNA-binding transcriptional regulator [Turicibacter sp.]|nr:LacI family DNA-binding transcriptional regulator [Turicibacter sp.]